MKPMLFLNFYDSFSLNVLNPVVLVFKYRIAEPWLALLFLKILSVICRFEKLILLFRFPIAIAPPEEEWQN